MLSNYFPKRRFSSEKLFEEEIIKIESNYDKMNNEFWSDDDHKIKKGCGINRELKDKYLLYGLIDSCKTSNRKDKYIYRDYKTAMKYQKNNQEIYACPKYLGFHIRSTKNVDDNTKSTNRNIKGVDLYDVNKILQQIKSRE